MSTELLEAKSSSSFYKLLSTTAKTSIIYVALKSCLPFLPKLIRRTCTMADIGKVLIDPSNLQSLAFILSMTLPIKLIDFFCSSENTMLSFATAFLSTLAGFSIEMKTRLIEFVVLSICSRSLFAVLNVFLERLKTTENSKRTITFAIFVFLCSSIISIGWMHKNCVEVKNLVTSYARPHKVEKWNMDLIRSILNVM